MAIGSLTAKDKAEVLLERSGLGKVFGKRNVVFAEDVAHLKPAPDVFLETAKRMNVDPSAQMIFEDSPQGVQAARAAGSKMVIGMPVILRPETIGALVGAGTYRIFFDWREIDLRQLLKEAEAV